MRILGHGIDIVETEDLVALFKRVNLDEVSLDWLTALEHTDLPSNASHRTAHLAGQMAAKEAVAKALGTGLYGDMAWTDIEVLREKGGRPYVVLHGAAAATEANLGIAEWSISITHTSTIAAASAIALGT